MEKTLSGPMIIAPDGRLVWFKYVRGGAYAFRAQQYEGKPVLTWWQGDVQRGFGYGEGVIYDQSYRRIATVKTGKGQRADLHEFVITPQNTALLIAYKIVRGDLRAVKGGSKNDLVMDNIVQEVDIKTGRVLLDWHTLGSISPSESYTAVPKDPKLPYDYAHLNSVELDSDGNLLVSARATHAVYRINRRTGKLMERIGGKRSDYRMGRGTRTAWQHDARRINATQISLYDNNAEERTTPISKHQTRGVILNIDEREKTVTLAGQIRHENRVIQAASQGNMQVLPNGNRFMGWGGSVPYFTEIDPKGETVLEGRYLAKRHRQLPRVPRAVGRRPHRPAAGGRSQALRGGGHGRLDELERGDRGQAVAHQERTDRHEHGRARDDPDDRLRDDDARGRRRSRSCRSRPSTPRATSSERRRRSGRSSGDPRDAAVEGRDVHAPAAVLAERRQRGNLQPGRLVVERAALDEHVERIDGMQKSPYT